MCQIRHEPRELQSLVRQPSASARATGRCHCFDTGGCAYRCLSCRIFENSPLFSGPLIAMPEAMHTRPDSELITCGRNGDRSALSELFERYYPSSIRVARRILGSDEDARDVVQSAYLAAFAHFDTYRGEAQFNTWMTRIVKNHCFMHLRRPERRRACPIVEHGEVKDAIMALARRTPTPEDLAWRGEVDAAFSKAACRLPKILQDVYTLVSVSGFCLNEAAHTLGLTLPATKTRLFRAQRRLRPELARRFAAHTRHNAPTVPPGRNRTFEPSRIAA